jgi:hypothetical protein
MSRLSTLSLEAIKQLQSPDADSTFITLLTIYELDGITPAIRLADNYTTRVSETPTDVIYGVVSRGQNFIFLPLSISLPSEDQNGAASRASITIKDVTRYITPIIRSLTYPPKIKLELVLSKTPDTLEVAYEELFISNFSYNSSQISASLSAVELDREPFPAYSFTPQFFAGLF